MKESWPDGVSILLSHIRKMLWDIVSVKIYSHMISEFLPRRYRPPLIWLSNPWSAELAIMSLALDLGISGAFARSLTPHSGCLKEQRFSTLPAFAACTLGMTTYLL